MENSETTLEERNNAVISYCFLAFIMLLSRDERYKNDFVRSHSRYAFLIHVAFLALIFAYIRSQNFSSVILYNTSWINIIFFLLFFLLLALLGNGLYLAFKGEKPRLLLTSLSIKNIQSSLANESQVSSEEKTLILLSHIPLLGSYFGAKYGGKCLIGEKFSLWVMAGVIISLHIDTSLFFPIIILVISTFWLVYQSIDGQKSVFLLAEKWWSVQDIEIFLGAIIKFCGMLFRKQSSLPSWQNTIIEERTKYTSLLPQNTTPLLFIPLINIVQIGKNWKQNEEKILAFEGLMTTIIVAYGVYAWSMSWILLGITYITYGHMAVVYSKDVRMPILFETSKILQYLIGLKKKKHALESVGPVQIPSK